MAAFGPAGTAKYRCLVIRKFSRLEVLVPLVLKSGGKAYAYGAPGIDERHSARGAFAENPDAPAPRPSTRNMIITL